MQHGHFIQNLKEKFKQRKKTVNKLISIIVLCYNKQEILQEGYTDNPCFCNIISSYYNTYEKPNTVHIILFLKQIKMELKNSNKTFIGGTQL